MAHKFEIYKNKAVEFRVRFMYNSEVISPRKAILRRPLR